LSHLFVLFLFLIIIYIRNIIDEHGPLLVTPLPATTLQMQGCVFAVCTPAHQLGGRLTLLRVQMFFRLSKEEGMGFPFVLEGKVCLARDAHFKRALNACISLPSCTSIQSGDPAEPLN